MAKTLSPELELEQIRRDRERLRAEEQALASRERNAREAIERQANALLSSAFSKGKFAPITKAQAVQLARRVAAIGIVAALGKLGS